LRKIRSENINYSPKQVEAMRAIFERVENKENWKLPIDATIELDTANKLLLDEAIIFFTGSVPHFHKLAGGKYRITADGYYMAIGA
jgi:hypothetical protein